MTRRSHGLADRPGKPYPATFRMLLVDSPGIEPGLPPRQGGVFPLDHEPEKWSAGESNPDYLGASQASSRWTSVPKSKRSVRELNPAFRLTTAACRRNTYRPFVKSDPGWSRTMVLLDVGQASSPLDHGIMLSVTRVGVEPTKSPRPQRDRFACLRTWSFRK